MQPSTDLVAHPRVSKPLLQAIPQAPGTASPSLEFPEKFSGAEKCRAHLPGLEHAIPVVGQQKGDLQNARLILRKEELPSVGGPRSRLHPSRQPLLRL